MKINHLLILYEPAMSAFLKSISLKKPEDAPAQLAPVSSNATAIVGASAQNLGAHMTYGDPVTAGMAERDGPFSSFKLFPNASYLQTDLIKQSEGRTSPMIGPG